MRDEPTRYELVSRRALLKASAGLGLAIVVPSACGTGDASVFAGAVAEAVPTPVPETVPLPTPTPAVEATPVAEPTALPDPVETATPETAASEPATSEIPTDPTATPEPVETASQLAVAGEMIVSFTYTQGPTGKNERPYVAVWVEDAAGELAATVSLWYQQQRRGERWLDHLHRWYEVDPNAPTAGASVAAISSATREAGSYAVAWDGTTAAGAAPAGTYFVCIESVREDGPYSLIREPLVLAGALAETALPDDGELSAATVRIDA